MIRLVVGDTKPDLVFNLLQDNVALDTDAITSVTFKLKKPTGSVLTVPMTLADAATAKYVGNFGPDDLDEAQPDAPMYGEVLVVFTDASEQHSERPLEVWVRDEYEDFA